MFISKEKGTAFFAKLELKKKEYIVLLTTFHNVITRTSHKQLGYSKTILKPQLKDIHDKILESEILINCLATNREVTISLQKIVIGITEFSGKPEVHLCFVVLLP